MKKSTKAVATKVAKKVVPATKKFNAGVYEKAKKSVFGMK